MTIPIYDAGRSFDMTTLTANYQNVGTAMTTAVLGFVIFNTSDVDAQLSFNGGGDDGPIVPAGGSIDSSRYNKFEKSEGKYVLEEGAQIQVKWIDGSAGTTGKIIVNIARR